jgi:hypothetical protein
VARLIARRAWAVSVTTGRKKRRPLTTVFPAGPVSRRSTPESGIPAAANKPVSDTAMCVDQGGGGPAAPWTISSASPGHMWSC